MRVLVMTVVHDPEDARIRFRQIEALRKADHEVIFAAPFTDYRRERPPGIECIDLPRALGRRRAAAAMSARRVLRRRSSGVDIVLVHDPEILLATAGVPIPRLVWDVHEDTAAAVAMKPWIPGLVRPAASRLAQLAERFAERRARLLLAERSYAKRFRSPHPVVPNSVLTTAGDIRPPDDDRVVYLGRLTGPRGAHEMIEIGRRLSPRPRIELIGNADADCLAAVRNAHETGLVTWQGFVRNIDALPALRGALAGLSLLAGQANYAHSRPTKIMEYMANGVPVITTPNPSSAELVLRHDCGLVVPFGDVDAACSAIIKLRDDSELRRRLAANGRAAAERLYSWDRDGSAFVRLLEQWVQMPT